MQPGELVKLGDLRDASGAITVAEVGAHVPFPINRIYFLHSLSTDAVRGGHAHVSLEQLIIPVSGAFSIALEHATRTVVLEANDPTTGIYIPPFTWRVLTNFSPNTVCLVLASERFDEADYIRDYSLFSEKHLHKDTH